MVYDWFRKDKYTLPEQIVGPIPDFLQIIFSGFYMFTCLAGSNLTGIATALTFMTKYLQAAFLTYVYVLNYLNGSRHDTFVASFALMKQFFNVVDATNYVLGNPLDHLFI